MPNNFYYNILSVNALELVRSANRERILRKEGKAVPPTYLLDLTDSLLSGSSLVVSMEAQKTNALYDQILLDTDDEFCALRYRLSDADSLLKSIINVDFTDLFQKLGGIDGAEKMIREICETPAPFSTADHLNRLLNPHFDGDFQEYNLLQIRFKDGELCSFLPFDKSSSMSKNNRITFINSKLRDKLDRRLQLGFPFSKMRLQLSKYYAYRGLYLSAGTRIHEDGGNSFVLNEKTVLILPDLMLDPRGDFLSKNERTNFLPHLYVSDGVPEPGKQHTFSDVYQRAEKINAFDGEGLIHPDFSTYINAQLSSPGEHRKTSFQIRMPFAKGMLHEVDFEGFLSAYGESLTVTDYFGIRRSLKDVRIILTASMFKCCKWLKQYKEENGDIDPVKIYFERFRTYDHALYVCGTNASISDTKLDTLSYQFLDTMALKSEEFDELIEQHFANSWGELSRCCCGDGDSGSAVVAAAKKNRGFRSDPRLVEETVRSCKKMRAELVLGHLLTPGGHFFASADLLTFLYYLKDLAASGETKDAEPEIIEGAEPSEHYPGTLQPDQFYLPNACPELSPEKYYALLRSPHLSRTEELLLRPYIPKGEEDPYRKYFGHLTGVLMFPAASFAPMILGGMDFDGDLCKLYTDERIAEAIRREVYTKKYQRCLPVTIIPSEDSLTAIPDNREFVKLIINTFSNCTGLISNIAVKFAETEYNSNRTAPRNEHNCELAGPVACLEIDSCKHGRHPCEDIKYLQHLAREKGKASRGFLELKNTIKQLRYPFEIEETKGKYSLYFSKGQKPLNISEAEPGSHNLLRLPYEFARRAYAVQFGCDKDKGDKDELLQRGILSHDPANGPLFVFEDRGEKYGAAGLSDVGMEETEKLMIAYTQLKNDMAAYRRQRNAIREIPEFSFLYTLLAAKYDSVNERFPLAGGGYSVLTVSNTLDVFLDALRRLPNSRLKSFNYKDWIWLKKKDRLPYLSKHFFDGGTLPSPEIETLFCDFTANGFLLLGLACVIAQKQQTAWNAIHKLEEKQKKKNGYYRELKDLLLPEEPNLGQVDSCPSEGNEEDHGDDSALSDLSVSSRMINQKCHELLLKIAENHNISYDADPEATAVKYAWAVTYGKERKDTSFFWDVLPKDKILAEVLEDDDDA